MIYVDDMRVPARIGQISGRWSHLTADTPAELHEFAEKIGLRRAWFQARCKHGACPVRDGVCAHFHYDVTDSRRDAAIRAGARAIRYRDLGAITSARRPYYRGEVA